MVVSLRTYSDDLYILWKQRIEERRPFQYLVGCEHWRDLVLSVQDGVLIPRPETELIVDLVSDVITENEVLKEGLWSDLRADSGALAIGIRRILGSCGRVIATDLSLLLLQLLLIMWTGIVNNPPCIPREDPGQLEAEVAKHEPKIALDGGSNGMNDLLHLCNGAASMLRPGGFLLLRQMVRNRASFLWITWKVNQKGASLILKLHQIVLGSRDL